MIVKRIAFSLLEELDRACMVSGVKKARRLRGNS
jgi:hypothetical protein